MSTFLKGKKTYIGLAVALIGAVGFSDYVTEAETAKIIDYTLQIVGILLAIYGRYKAGK